MPRSRPFRRTGAHEVTEAVRNWCQPAKDYSALDYAAMLQDIARSRAILERSLRPYDYVLAPVLPVVSFPAEAPGVSADVPLRHANFTAMFNQTAQPASSVHQALSAGFPWAFRWPARGSTTSASCSFPICLSRRAGPSTGPPTPRH